MTELWKILDMITLENRLLSLEAWPVSFIDKLRVAKSGFYFTGYKAVDAVECFVCNIGAGGWEEGDDPDREHQRLSPKCDYFRRRDMEFQYAPRNPHYAAIGERFRTFREWPTTLGQKPQQMVNAGFFYKNTGDRVCCYYCDITLHHWTPTDDPWKDHAFFSPSCAYVRIMRGDDFISETRETHQPVVVDFNIRRNMEQMDYQESGISVEHPDLCPICMNEYKNICYVPCGHIAACARCALTSRQCPICRNVFKDTIRIVI